MPKSSIWCTSSLPCPWSSSTWPRTWPVVSGTAGVRSLQSTSIRRCTCHASGWISLKYSNSQNLLRKVVQTRLPDPSWLLKTEKPKRTATFKCTTRSSVVITRSRALRIVNRVGRDGMTIVTNNRHQKKWNIHLKIYAKGAKSANRIWIKYI